MLEVVSKLVAHGDQSVLGGRLGRETGLATHVAAHARFPGLGDPSLFTIELTGKPGKDYESLVKQALELVEELRSEPDRHEVERAISNWQAAERRIEEDPERLAVRTARLVGLHGPAVLEDGGPTVKSISAAMAELFSDRRLTMVRTVADAGKATEKGNGR